MKQPKKDTSHMLTPQPGGFTVNEWLEGRLALRGRDPAKYLRETSQALRLTVERYAELKGIAERESSIVTE
jgi:hypothetical protein